MTWRLTGRASGSLAAALLLSMYAFLAATGVREKSIAFDELAHITAGVASWTTGDYRLFPQNGQLPQRWAAIPLLAGFQFPTREQSAWWTSDLEGIGYQFLYGVGNAHETLLWRARMMMMPIAVALGAICYFWARRLFGVAGGLVTLFIFTFSPSMLAHGPLATSDLFSALMFTAAVGSFWWTLHRPDPGRVAGSAVLMGLLFVTKMSAFVMVPVTIVLVAVRVWRRRPLVRRGRRVFTRRSQLVAYSIGILFAHAIGAVLVIWASYGFRYATFRDAVSGRDRMFLGETIDSLAGRTAARPAILLARDLHLLPEPYVFGVAHVLNRSGRHIGFLNGAYSVDGWWYFFPYCWLVKTPLPIMALVGLGVSALRRRWAHRARKHRHTYRALYALVPVIVFPTVYWLVAMASPLNLGERHLLPTYPALFILAGAAGGWFRSEHRRLGAAAVVALLAVLGAESMAIRPHYLAYFNALAGGPESGYRHLVDSSLDWGQDLPGLKRWLEAAEGHAAVPAAVYLSYFGSGNPAVYGIHARQIYSYQDWRAAPPLYELTGGIYCVSATMLQSLYTRAAGPWAAPYERAYQMARRELEPLQQREGTAASAPQLSDDEATTRQRRINEFDQLRTSRLFAFLRQRKPDDQVGYSILIFRLSDADVERALHGPPAELWPDIGVEGPALGGAVPAPLRQARQLGTE